MELYDKRRFEEGNGTMNFELYHGDCFEYMRKMPDKSVDHIITDPPYSRQVHENARSSKTGINEKSIPFDMITEEQFFKFCSEAIRITKRWVIITCAFEYAGEALKRRVNVIRVGVWVKPNPTPQFTGDRPGQGFETVLILHDEGRKRWNGGGMPAVWIFNKVQGKHPTKKPPALIKKWLDQFTDPGETIFDPFMGEGTTGDCCMDMGRNFIGCEIEKKWFDLAKKQIEDKAAQRSLF